MEIPDIASMIGTLRSTIGLIKDAQGLLPKGSQKEEIGKLVAEAENRAGAFEAEAAVKLGYPLCKGHWPPVIMLETETRFLFRCPRCGKDTDTSPASVSVGIVRSRSRLRDDLDHY